MSSMLCPCCSGQTYDDCCEPLLERRAQASNVKQLMRSRYCAFALGGQGDYLLDTWHPSTRGTLTAEFLSEKTLNWQGLKVLDFRHKGDEGMVKFEARYLGDNGQPGLLQEVSRFVRVNGNWFYLDSEQ